MRDIIKTSLGTRYRMFYNPAIPASSLTPGQTLDNACLEVNQQIDINGVNLSTWDAWKKDRIARLLWVNLFYQKLDHEPIRKPILVHKHNDKLLVDCGDTRLMALQLKSSTATVSAVVTCRSADSAQYSTWQPITCDMEFITATNFDVKNTTILVTATAPDADYAFEWMEIGDQSTAHHLHNIDHRIQMMQRYLNTQSTDFRFSVGWAQETINWTAFF